MAEESLTDRNSGLVDDVQHVCEEFSRARTYAYDAYGRLTDEQINEQPQSGGCSVAECLEHLCVTAEHYLPLIDRALDDAEARGLRKQPPYKRSLLAAWLIKQSASVPPKLKIKTPKVFRPVTTYDAAGIRNRFASFQDRLTEAAVRANGYDLGRVKVPSPVTRLLKFPLWQALQFLATHQRRHLWQADQVVREKGF